MNDAIRMQISAFVDGELPDNEADLLLRRMTQDPELRDKVAEYLAIGRVLRGETTLLGADRIHERVAAEIDDKPFEAESEATRAPEGSPIRPLARVAIAAAVALLAIFGLQRNIGVDEPLALTPGAVAGNDNGYTVPNPVDDQLRQYYLSHGAIAAENGANGINSRFVSLRIDEEAIADSRDDDESTTTDDTEDEPIQP